MEVSTLRKRGEFSLEQLIGSVKAKLFQDNSVASLFLRPIG